MSQCATPRERQGRMRACAGQAWMVLQMRQRSPLAQDRASAKEDMAAEGVPHRTTVAGPSSSCLAQLLVGAAQREACPPCPWLSGVFFFFFAGGIEASISVYVTQGEI